MKATALRWLVLLLIPGCLLVQPLDAAKPDDDDTVPSSSAGGPPKAGSSGGTSKAGSGNAGRGGSSSGGAPSGGGSPSGGAPSAVDFSLFTGTWTIASGQSTTTCDDGNPVTEPIDPGGMDQVGLGTSSDLIFGPGSSCEILADVADRTAYLNDNTASCSDTDGTFYYYLSFDYFKFAVSSNGSTADANMSTTVITADANGSILGTCSVEQSWKYKR